MKRLLLAFSTRFGSSRRACVLLFAIGLLVGQQAQRSKFEKYLRPTGVTEMQFALLEANMDIIRDSIATDVGVPDIYYDPACSCFWATTFLTHDLANKPIEELRNRLTAEVITTRINLKHQIPELTDSQSDPDFKMRFRAFRGTSAVTIAEYVDGKIVFR